MRLEGEIPKESEPANGQDEKEHQQHGHIPPFDRDFPDDLSLTTLASNIRDHTEVRLFGNRIPVAPSR
jgi:hypothetical protein